MVPWARVMASLHWAALRYCRITERLIETNDSNNGTLSPQAGFVAGLIRVVAARGTRHHADPSMEEAQVLFFPPFFFFSFFKSERAVLDSPQSRVLPLLLRVPVQWDVCKYV